jgi:hypothetical protein
VDKASGFAEHVFSIATKQRAFIQEHSQGIVAVSDFSTIFSFGEAKKGSNIVPLLPAQVTTREWVKKQKVRDPHRLFSMSVHAFHSKSGFSLSNGKEKMFGYSTN